MESVGYCIDSQGRLAKLLENDGRHYRINPPAELNRFFGMFGTDSSPPEEPVDNFVDPAHVMMFAPTEIFRKVIQLFENRKMEYFDGTSPKIPELTLPFSITVSFKNLFEAMNIMKEFPNGWDSDYYEFAIKEPMTEGEESQWFTIGKTGDRGGGKIIIPSIELDKEEISFTSDEEGMKYWESQFEYPKIEDVGAPSAKSVFSSIYFDDILKVIKEFDKLSKNTKKAKYLAMHKGLAEMPAIEKIQFELGTDYPCKITIPGYGTFILAPRIEGD